VRNLTHGSLGVRSVEAASGRVVALLDQPQQRSAGLLPFQAEGHAGEQRDPGVLLLADDHVEVDLAHEHHVAVHPGQQLLEGGAGADVVGELHEALPVLDLRDGLGDVLVGGRGDGEALGLGAGVSGVGAGQGVDAGHGGGAGEGLGLGVRGAGDGALEGNHGGQDGERGVVHGPAVGGEGGLGAGDWRGALVVGTQLLQAV
jgi:hypothetical protein